MRFRLLLVSLLVWLVGCETPPSGDLRSHPLRDRDGTEETTDGNEPDAPKSAAPKPATTSAPKGEVGKWTWRDIPGSMCANGEQTGIAMNVGTGTELVIFLMGGGACWDEATCALGTASNLEKGYTKEIFEADLAGDLGDLLKGSFYDRDVPENPYRNATLIFVPYCTGDVFSGDAEQQFLLSQKTMHYAGRRNIDAMLKVVVPEFKEVTKVTFSGASAGGFGAAINYWRVKEAFGKTPVDLIDDSGPPFEESQIPLMPLWRHAWNLSGALPPDCNACQDDIGEVPAYYSKKFPSDHFAYLSHDLDPVISLFFATPIPIWTARLNEMNDRIAQLPNARFYVAGGLEHTMLAKLTTASGDKDSVPLSRFLTQLDTSSPQWANVSPD